MCNLCNGATVAQQLGQLDLDVQARGYAVIVVEATTPWAYTIGLSDRLHPELVVAGGRQHTAAAVLGALADRVVQGERLQPDSVVEESGARFGLVAVHPTRLSAGLCGWWPLYDRLHHGAGRLEALQVRLPREWFCACHADSQPHLELPGRTPWTSNRESRRRLKRHR